MRQEDTGKMIPPHSKAVGRQGRRLSGQKPQRVKPRRRVWELGATPSEIGQKTLWKAWRASYGVTERVAEDTCETWDCTLRSVAGYVTSRGQIAGRRRWSRYGESPRRRNVRDGRCEGDGAGLPRRDLRAVAVPGEFCVIKSRLRANLKLCRVIPQHINKPVTGGHAPPPPENFGFLGVCWCILGQNRPTCVYAIWSSKLAMQNKVKCYITCELLCGYLQQLLTQIDSVRDNCTFIKKSWFVYSDNVITRLILQVTHHVHALLFILSNYGG